MANNISRDYITFVKKCLHEYLKLILENKYKKEISNLIVNKYIDIRYYNELEDKYSNMAANINYHLKDYVSDMMNTTDVDYKETSKNTYLCFRYLLYFDDVSKYDNLKSLVSEINKFKKDRLNIHSEDFTNNFIEVVKKHETSKKNYLKSVNNERFGLTKAKTNLKNVYYIELLCNFTFPKIYSNYAIRKVYNKGIINEDKMFITYHLVNNLVLNNIISGIYNQYYIVDFPITIKEKPDKMERIFSIIDDDSIRDNIIINIKYEDYIENKEMFDSYIKNGFRFSITIDKTFKYSEKEVMWLDIFTYIIDLDKEIHIDDMSKVITRK